MPEAGNWAESPVEPGAALLAYDLLRSVDSGDFDSGTCIESGIDTIATDAAVPAGGQVYYYLIRSRNRCGGNLGTDSSGQPRTGIACSPF